MLKNRGSFIFKKFIAVLFLISFTTSVSAAKVKQVEIESEGTGPTLHSAVNNALSAAIAQVHGKTIESERLSMSMEVSVTLNNDEGYLASEGYLEQVKETTKGAVSSYRILSKQETAAGNWRVNLAVKVAQYQRSKSADRMRLAILPMETSKASYSLNGRAVTASDVEQAMVQQLSNYLVQTRKFAVLDRSFTNQIEGELANANDPNAHIDEASRLGQKLVADYVLVGAIAQLSFKTSTKKMLNSDRTFKLGNGLFSVNYKIIEVATQQVVFSDSSEIKFSHKDLPSGVKTAAKSILSTMSSKLAKSLTFKIQDQIFPLAIVSKSGNQVVLSQGGSTVKIGEKYKVYKAGKKLYDPYTKEFMGRDETYCCVVTIARVTPKLAYGDVSSADMPIPTAVPKKTFLLREKVEIKREKKSLLRKQIKKQSASKDDDW